MPVFMKVQKERGPSEKNKQYLSLPKYVQLKPNLILMKWKFCEEGIRGRI